MTRVGLAIAIMVGCAPAPADLRAPIAKQLGAPMTARAIADRLAQPLDLDAAVTIALANNAHVAAALADIGIAGSDLALALGPTTVQASLRFGDGRETEVAILQEVLGLVAAPRHRAAARADIAAAQATAGALALVLAARVALAFHDLYAAQQDLGLRQDAFDAADAAALLRERMHAAGSATDLALARDRDAREQARIELARAQAAIELRRERITVLLGLTGDQTKWTATGALPALPADAPVLDKLEADAVTASLELAAARAKTDAAANRVAEQRLRTVVPQLAIGVAADDRDGPTRVGPMVALGLPVFDWNSAGRARAHAEARRADAELTATAVELRAAARVGRLKALAAYAEARHVRDVVLPLRQQILDETVKHYNAMDADPFALVDARTKLVDAHHQAIDAQRRYANAITVVHALERGALVEEELR